MQTPMPKPSPEQIAAAIYRASKTGQPPASFRDKMDVFKVLCLSTPSLPTITIVTRDRVAQEQEARRRADENRALYDVSAASALSPEILDV